MGNTPSPPLFYTPTHTFDLAHTCRYLNGIDLSHLFLKNIYIKKNNYYKKRIIIITIDSFEFLEEKNKKTLILLMNTLPFKDFPTADFVTFSYILDIFCPQCRIQTHILVNLRTINRHHSFLY